MKSMSPPCGAVAHRDLERHGQAERVDLERAALRRRRAGCRRQPVLVGRRGSAICCGRLLAVVGGRPPARPAVGHAVVAVVPTKTAAPIASVAIPSPSSAPSTSPKRERNGVSARDGGSRASAGAPSAASASAPGGARSPRPRASGATARPSASGAAPRARGRARARPRRSCRDGPRARAAGSDHGPCVLVQQVDLGLLEARVLQQLDDLVAVELAGGDEPRRRRSRCPRGCGGSCCRRSRRPARSARPPSSACRRRRARRRRRRRSSCCRRSGA